MNKKNLKRIILNYFKIVIITNPDIVAITIHRTIAIGIANKTLLTVSSILNILSCFIIYLVN